MLEAQISCSVCERNHYNRNKDMKRQSNPHNIPNKKQKLDNGMNAPKQEVIPITPDEKRYLEDLRARFKTFKKGPQTQEMFNHFFKYCSNPYLFALKMFTNSSQNYENRKTNQFTFYILEALKTYVDTNATTTNEFLTDDIKIKAFHLTKSNPNGQLFEFIVPLFELQKNPEILMPFIDELVAKHDYGMACKFCEKLRLHDSSVIDKFLVPITFQKERGTNLVDFLNQAESLRIPFLQKLDSLLEGENSIEKSLTMCEKYEGVPEEHLTFDYVRQRMRTLKKRFNVPIKLLPFYKTFHVTSTITFLTFHYAHDEIAYSTFDETVKELIQEDDIDLHMTLVTHLLHLDKPTEALKWLSHFNYEMGDLPIDIQEFIVKSSENEILSESVAKNDRPNFYKVDPRIVDIEFIDNSESFGKMVDHLKAVDYISVHCEAKPNWNDLGGLSLMQIGCKNKAFILDVLSEDLTTKEWTQVEAILNNEKVLKIGFKLILDFNIVFKSKKIGFKVADNTKGTSFLDMRSFFKFLSIQPFYEEFISKYYKFGVNYNYSQLSGLVKLILDKELDHGTRYSNWIRRPLRPEQIHYAAANVCCLFEIYDIINESLKSVTEVGMKELINQFNDSPFKKPS